MISSDFKYILRRSFSVFFARPNLAPIVGDQVQVQWTEAAADAEAVVTEVLPRKTTLLRRPMRS